MVPLAASQNHLHVQYIAGGLVLIYVAVMALIASQYHLHIQCHA